MAQVTMDSKEYLEMVDKVRTLEKVESKMVDNVTFELTPDNKYSTYNIRIITTFTDSAKKLVVDKIVEMVKSHEDVLKELVKENQHVLDLVTGSIHFRWDRDLDPTEVDLLDNKEFKEAWERMQDQVKNEFDEEDK